MLQPQSLKTLALVKGYAGNINPKAECRSNVEAAESTLVITVSACTRT